MTKFALGLVGAVALSMGVLEQPSAAQQPTAPQKLKPGFSRGHGIPMCNFHCPPGLHVCPSDDTDPKTGCPVSYRCVHGLPGSNDCP